MKFPSHVDLAEDAREDIIELLNICLADSIDLHWQVKQAHWNVRGIHFISRHELFDEVAKHVRGQTDKLAERAGQLGGYAYGTIRLAAKNSELPEYDLAAVSGDEHLKVLVDRVSLYASSLRKGIHRCEELEDPVTAELLTELTREIEEDLWFLESHLHGSKRVERQERASPDIREELAPSPSP